VARFVVIGFDHFDTQCFQSLLAGMKFGQHLVAADGRCKHPVTAHCSPRLGTRKNRHVVLPVDASKVLTRRMKPGTMTFCKSR